MESIIAHYSELAFKTRIYALTFAGAVISAYEWLLKTSDSSQIFNPNLLAWALLLVTGSLSFLNHRYTNNYLIAVSSLSEFSEKDEKTMWYKYKTQTEKSYIVLKTDKSLVKIKKLTNRFLLSWGTYFPGIAGSLYLFIQRIKSSEINIYSSPQIIGILCLIILVISWMWVSLRSQKHDKFYVNSK